METVDGRPAFSDHPADRVDLTRRYSHCGLQGGSTARRTVSQTVGRSGDVQVTRWRTGTGSPRMQLALPSRQPSSSASATGIAGGNISTVPSMRSTNAARLPCNSDLKTTSSATSSVASIATSCPSRCKTMQASTMAYSLSGSSAQASKDRTNTSGCCCHYNAGPLACPGCHASPTQCADRDSIREHHHGPRLSAPPPSSPDK